MVVQAYFLKFFIVLIFFFFYLYRKSGMENLVEKVQNLIFGKEYYTNEMFQI